MKKPFDRMIGPDGEWNDSDAEANDLSDREDFALRCLNAAANLYGVLSFEEFRDLYNRYAADETPEVAKPMTEDELATLIPRLKDLAADDDEECPSMEDICNRPEVWFDRWRDPYGKWHVVQENLTSLDDHGVMHADEIDKRINRHILDVKSRFLKVPLKVLGLDDFLAYEDPMCDEDFPETECLEHFLSDEYGLDEDMAEWDVMGIRSHLRFNGDSVQKALEYIDEMCEWRPENSRQLDRLIGAISPAARATRTWYYRGNTAFELADMKLLPDATNERIEDVFGLDGEDGEYLDCGEDDVDDECPKDEYYSDLPPAKYTGPVDFRFVKDPVQRDQRLYDYQRVRDLTCDFVSRVVMKEMTDKERTAAKKRLGIDPKAAFSMRNANLDMVAGDFGSMMDDQKGEPAIRRLIAKKNTLPKLDQLALSYYENYRYTWLEVLAAKAGVGVKCRDLLTGEELFLMEMSFSRDNVKGKTICAGIAPMGDVYCVLGVIHPADFENPQAILKIVLTHLKLPTELPITLSFADQARFAAETIKRLNANDKFSTIAYG